jgi:hypothetical protein
MNPSIASGPLVRLWLFAAQGVDQIGQHPAQFARHQRDIRLEVPIGDDLIPEARLIGNTPSEQSPSR